MNCLHLIVFISIINDFFDIKPKDFMQRLVVDIIYYIENKFENIDFGFCRVSSTRIKGTSTNVLNKTELGDELKNLN